MPRGIVSITNTFLSAISYKQWIDFIKIGKKGIFKCKINSVKKPKEVEVTDEFAKTLGAKDLNDLKKIISKQINQEFKNSLNIISKNQILKGLEQIKVEDLPQSLIDEEVKVLGQGQTEEELKKK